MKFDNQIKRIGIIGAGSAGLAAAVSAGRILSGAEGFDDWNIDLIEKNTEPGKKLLATGNGKCNITNINAGDFQICEGFFRDLGILLTEENDGRMYPHSKQALVVRDTLLAAAIAYGINLKTKTVIEKIDKKSEEKFVLTDDTGNSHEYDRIIIATGGKSGMQYGSSGDGIKFARSLNVKTKSIQPVLVPVTYGDNPRFDLPSLKGVRAMVKLTLKSDGRVVEEEEGELQFTQYGLSGICIFNLSRHLRCLVKKDNRFSDCVIDVDFAPKYSEEELFQILDSNLQAGLKGIINEKIEALFLKAGLKPATDSIETAKLLKSFPITIGGTKGWKEAQATSGGVSLSEVNMHSMQSKNVPNLFFAGEVLDYDGACGGYNLTWAWKTGIQAGLGVIDGIESDKS